MEVIINETLKKEIIGFYKATHADTATKTLFCLTVQFDRDSVEYNFWEEMNVNSLLAENIVGVTSIGNLTIAIACEPLNTTFELDKDRLMNYLRPDFPEMYQRYREAKSSTPRGEKIWVNEPAFINDNWQRLRFVHDSLVYKMQPVN